MINRPIGLEEIDRAMTDNTARPEPMSRESVLAVLDEAMDSSNHFGRLAQLRETRAAVAALYADKERLDWLEKQVSEGACPAVVNDDNGHWAVAFDGMQNVPDSEAPCDIQTSFFIEASAWSGSIREAIDRAITGTEASNAEGGG